MDVVTADARHTGLPSDSFDLVHARTVLVTIPEPEEVLAEMVRLTRPGGWVASQEPDTENAFCYPPLPAWDRLREIFRASFGRSGADLLVGRRLPELYRQAGLEEIEVVVHAPVYPAAHSRRTILPDLVRSLRPMILDLQPVRRGGARRAGPRGPCASRRSPHAGDVAPARRHLGPQACQLNRH